MAEQPKPNSPPHSLSNEDVKASNIFPTAKEEIEAAIHAGEMHHFHKETHGKRNDIDENTSLNDVKAPNVFERAKEEIEALVEAIHHKKVSHSHDCERDHSAEQGSKLEKIEHDVKAPNLIERAKKETKAHFHKETQGKHDDSDENTPLDDAKAPNVFEAKEEIDALVETIHCKRSLTSLGIRKGIIPPRKNQNMRNQKMVSRPPSLIERVREEIDAILHKKSPHHHHHRRRKETLGRNEDIDETTPANEVKALNVFERAKEEVEAIVEAIHPNPKS